MSDPIIRNESLHLAHSVSLNSAAVFASEICSKLGAFAVTIFLVRQLGKESYGVLVFAFTYVEIFQVLANLGVNSITVRELSVLRGEALAEFWRNAHTLRWALTCISAILAIVAAKAFYGENPLTLSSLMWVSLCLLPEVRSVYSSVLTANMKPSWSAGINFVKTLLYAGFSFLFLQLGLGVVGVIQASFAASVTAMVCERGLANKFIPQGGRFDLSRAKKILSWSWPLAASSLLTFIQLRLDIFMLKGFMNDAEVGSYGVAVRMIEGAFMMSSAVAVALYPVLSRSFTDDKLFWERLVKTSVNFLLILSIPFVAIMGPLSQPMITLLFGKNLNESAAIMNILCFAVPLGYVNVLLANLLIIGRWQKLEFYASVATTAANAVGNFILIPLLKGQGAALATVFCQVAALISLGAIFCYKSHFRWELSRVLKLCLIGLACWLLNVWLRNSVNWLLLGTALSVLFMFFAYRVTLDAKEKALAKKILQKIILGYVEAS